MNQDQINESTKEILRKEYEEPEQDVDTQSERIIKLLTVDKSIPEDLSDKMWATSDKEIVLSNFDKDDITRLRNRQKIIELSMLASLPPDSYDFDQDLNMRQMDVKFFIKTKRSYKGFERQLQNTQIRTMNIRTDPSQQKVQTQKSGSSMLGRLFGRKPRAED